MPSVDPRSSSTAPHTINVDSTALTPQKPADDALMWTNGVSSPPKDSFHYVPRDSSDGGDRSAKLLQHKGLGRAPPSARHGRLGRFLYHTSWGWHLYITFLVVVVAGCEFGLVLLNRFLFMTGTWRFPFPVALTFAQVLATHAMLLVSASLTRSLHRPLSWLGLEGLIAPPQGIFTSSTFKKLDFRTLGFVLPLTLIFVLKLMFSTLSIAYAILPKYTLFRVYIVPTSVMSSWIFLRTNHSVSTILSSLSAVYYLSMASHQAGPPVDTLSSILGFVSTPLVAFYPILFLYSFNKIQDRLVSHEKTSIPAFVTDSPSSQPPRTAATAHWYLIYNLSLLTTIIMAVVFLVSGDIWHVWQNCYILDQYKLWIPIVGSFLTSFGVFVATPLLIRATSPLTATFLMVPRSALQLALLHSDMPKSCWVGVFGCYLSSAWYLIARRMESGPLK